MTAAIYLLSSALAPPVVCACAAAFLAWLGWRTFTRAVERRLGTMAGGEEA